MPIYYKNMKGILDDGLVKATANRQRLLVEHVHTIMRCNLPVKVVQDFIERTNTVTLGEALPTLMFARIKAVHYINSHIEGETHPV